jgi:hypothetical protein
VAAPLHPAVARIVSVARALGELSGDVVFIGGAIAPLLQTNQVIPRVRPTDDVDAIVASTQYASYSALEERIRALGFTTEIAEQKHAHRWRAPDGTPFDLVPAGKHLGGTGGEWDAMAIAEAVESEVGTDFKIRHASAMGFLGLKWAAFWDRGVQDPFRSEDLEDILALLVSRNELVREFKESPARLQDHIRDGLRWLQSSDDYEDLVAAHLGSATAFTRVAALLRTRIQVMLAP